MARTMFMSADGVHACVHAGVPVAWKLVPAPSPPVYADASNEHSRRGAFATKQLWVTPHSDDERWPAGEYPLMAGDTNNIVTWTGLVRAHCTNCCPAYCMQPALRPVPCSCANGSLLMTMYLLMSAKSLSAVRGTVFEMCVLPRTGPEHQEQRHCGVALLRRHARAAHRGLVRMPPSALHDILWLLRL